MRGPFSNEPSVDFSIESNRDAMREELVRLNRLVEETGGLQAVDRDADLFADAYRASGVLPRLQHGAAAG